MRKIPPLYHWTPESNVASIFKHGLRPTTPHRDGTLTVCLGTDALTAWVLSGSAYPCSTEHRWALLQVHVADTPVFIVRQWGRISEIRVPRVILAKGVRLIAFRDFR